MNNATNHAYHVYVIVRLPLSNSFGTNILFVALYGMITLANLNDPADVSLKVSLYPHVASTIHIPVILKTLLLCVMVIHVA